MKQYYASFGHFFETIVEADSEEEARYKAFRSEKWRIKFEDMDSIDTDEFHIYELE